MRMRKSLIVNLVVATTLAACNTEHHDGYHDDYHDHDDVVVYDDPEITFFELIDTYGYSSMGPLTAALNPYEDDGYFQVNWTADTRDDYTVEYRVNDLPELAGSVLIDSERCGYGLGCERDGTQFCQYNADSTMTCDADERRDRSFSHKIFALPQSMYFILHVCSMDGGYCEYTTEEFTAE